MSIKSPTLPAMGNLGIRAKLWLVVLVLTVPMTALLLVQYQQRQDDISFAQSESHGLDFVVAANTVLRDLQLHRGLAQEFINGDKTAEAALDKAAQTTDADLAALSSLDQKYGGDFETRQLVTSIKDQWTKLKATPAGQTPSENALAHTRIIDDGVLPLIDRVAVNSRLVVDPNIDSRSLINALTDSLPRTTEALSQVRSDGAAALLGHNGEAPTVAQKANATAQLLAAAAGADAMARSIDTAIAHNSRFANLRPLIDRSNVSRQTFVSSTDANIGNASTLSAGTAQPFFILANGSIDAANKVLETAQAGLQDEFQSRVDSAQSALIFTSIAAIGGVLIAIVLALIIAQSITRPVARLAEVADRMSLGELDIEIDVSGTNEVGQLAESLRRMQASLRSAIERLRVRRAA